MRKTALLGLATLPFLGLLAACGGAGADVPAPAVPPPPPPVAAVTPVAPVAAPAVKHDQIDRGAFNRVAQRLNLPLFWTVDADKSNSVDPGEVASLLFYPTSDGAEWVKDDGTSAASPQGGPHKLAFTPAFEDAYARIVSSSKEDPKGSSAEDTARRKLVVQDLDQGRATLVANDMTGLSADQKAFVQHVLKAAALVDDLYATQIGAKQLAGNVPADDLASQSLFRRDWGPKCLAPMTEKNPACSAIPGAPKPLVDVYPSDLQKDPKFCEGLEKLPNSKALLDPFTVVRGAAKGSLEPVSYSVAYKAQMEAISAELKAAQNALTDTNEGPMRAYLAAAAQSFVDNNWVPSDEAWAKMNATNSQFYLRIAPDEVYWEPCNHKAGFHVTFARINKDSLAWQDKLVPVEQDMEKSLAAHIGKPYAERKVTFHLPDFIDIVVNAGDDRNPSGATIGQSLPNVGPVANEGRGRTVAMSNLYTDPDSIEARKTGATTLLSTETMAVYEPGQTPGLLNTILHEATHNLGPAHEYKFKGKTDAQAFGGGLASMMEELKAQTGALYFTEYLRKKGIIDDKLAKQVYVDDLVWAFGHISRGMYTAAGGRKAYSQLAAIQVGFFMSEGAITFDPNAKAANGQDTGALTIHFEKMPAAVDKLMKIVGGYKATGDRAGAEKLAKKFVDGDVVPQKVITDRWLRNPKASFVYGVKL